MNKSGRSRLPALASAEDHQPSPVAEHDQLVEIDALREVAAAAGRVSLSAELLISLSATKLPGIDSQRSAAEFLLTESFSALAGFFTPGENFENKGETQR